MLRAQTLDSKVMKYSADCVEWCPIKDFQNMFVCGTYQLIKDNGEKLDVAKNTSRLGSINLYSVSQNGSLVLEHSLETPAVLDMKWCYQTSCLHEPMLAVANAEGEVNIFYLRREGENFALVYGESIMCVEKKGTLALSIDWNSRDLQLVTSDSSGTVSLLNLSDGALEKVQSWNSHSHEAWITTFDFQDPNIVYSGGDDCKMIIYDSRQKCQVLNLRKEHSAGVTALSCWKEDNILASGSYDEKLRLWDKRNWKSPRSETDLGGGVWKVKWCPSLNETMKDHLLVACMHAGFKLVDWTKMWKGESTLESLTYSDHESLAYGCDWCHSQLPLQLSSDEENGTYIRGLIASCSFYDNKLCLWAVQKK